MSMRSTRNANVGTIATLFLLAFGSLALSYHRDFLAGFGIAAGVVVLAMSAWKRKHPGVPSSENN